MFFIHEICTPTRVDENKNLKLFSAFQMINDCCDMWFDSEPVLKNYFLEKNKTQMATFRQVDVIRVPKMGEKLTISTSLYRCEKYFGFRNDIIRDEQGNPCYLSNSMGVGIDLNTNKLGTLPPEILQTLTFDKMYDMEYKDRKIRLPKIEPTEMPTVKVKRNDIDYNHHMNNCQYIRIALEIIPKGFSPKSVRVEYKTPVKLDDVLTPLLYSIDGVCYVVLKCGETTAAIMEFV